MIRRSIIFGNWKMNLGLGEAEALARGMVSELAGMEGVDVGVCPPFVYLPAVGNALRGSSISLAGQNLHPEARGAFTGEVSGAMLREVGCTHVLVGHSERRHVLGEDEAFVSAKLRAALRDGLTPILCVGETLDERERWATDHVVTGQLESALNGVAKGDAARVVIAYEPVWAIGTGKTATPAQAQEVHAKIRALLARLYDGDLAAAARIQYGGSVNEKNAAELLSQPDVDGALVGGASLKMESFAAIVRAGAG